METKDPKNPVVEAGDHVLVVDTKYAFHNALVEIAHGVQLGPEWCQENGPLTINALYLAKDPNMTDNHGRQKMHVGSIIHWSKTSVDGNCWMWPWEREAFRARWGR